MAYLVTSCQIGAKPPATRLSTKLVVLLFLATSFAAGQEKITVEDLLQRHLDSIGPAAARAATKSRVIEATAAYRIIVGGSGEITGRAFIVSDADKLQMRLKVNAQQYNGEKFVRDGTQTSVAGTYADKTRSEFGRFLWSEDAPLREGLLGGVLTTGWPLLQSDASKKLRYQGVKNVDGKRLYSVTYQPKKNSDLDIVLYFDLETFHHVLTVYSATVHPGLGRMGEITGGGMVAGSGSEQASARQQQTRYRIEERFSDFKTTDGVTLPAHYDLRYQQELQSGFTKLVEWDVTSTRVLSNVSVDARNFQID